MSKVTTVGIDLAKNTFGLLGWALKVWRVEAQSGLQAVAGAAGAFGALHSRS